MDNFFKVFSGGRGGVVMVPKDWPGRQTASRQDEAEGEIKDWDQPQWPMSPGDFTDYLNTDTLLRLCSERLRAVLDATKAENDILQWLPVEVLAESGETRNYWRLHFPDPPDVLDQTRVRMLGGVIERTVLDPHKIDGHRLMPSPDGSIWCFVISEEGRQAIAQAGCTGMIFRPVAMSPERGTSAPP